MNKSHGISPDTDVFTARSKEPAGRNAFDQVLIASAMATTIGHVILFLQFALLLPQTTAGG